MTSQALENATAIRQDNTERVMINALFSELDRFKARTLRITIVSVILFSALVGCAVMAWQSYQGLLSEIDTANIAIHMPLQVWGMDFESTSSSYSSSNGVKSLGDSLANVRQAMSIMIKTIFPIMIILMLLANIPRLLNTRIDIEKVVLVIVLCLTIFSAGMMANNMLGLFDESGSSSKSLSKREIVNQLQSDDYDDFYQALSYIKSRNSDFAKYLEVQHKIKKDLNISVEDKDFIENKIANKEFNNIPNSSAYLFSQVSRNQYLLDMANTYKKEYYQEKKGRLFNM